MEKNNYKYFYLINKYSSISFPKRQNNDIGTFLS